MSIKSDIFAHKVFIKPIWFEKYFGVYEQIYDSKLIYFVYTSVYAKIKQGLESQIR